jgi:hypothetical protein
MCNYDHEKSMKIDNNPDGEHPIANCPDIFLITGGRRRTVEDLKSESENGWYKNGYLEHEAANTQRLKRVLK